MSIEPSSISPLILVWYSFGRHEISFLHLICPQTLLFPLGLISVLVLVKSQRGSVSLTAKL